MPTSLFPEEQSGLKIADGAMMPMLSKLVPLLHRYARQHGFIRTIEQWCVQSQPDLTVPHYDISRTLMREEGIQFVESCDISFFRFAALAYNGRLHIHPQTSTFINLFTPDAVVEYVRIEEAKYQRDLEPELWQRFALNRIVLFPRGCPHAAKTEDFNAWGIALEVRSAHLAEDDADTIVLPD